MQIEMFDTKIEIIRDYNHRYHMELRDKNGNSVHTRIENPKELINEIQKAINKVDTSY